MKKILVFIKDANNKLLLLKGNENDPQFHESFWYTVTGSKEDEDLTLIDTVIRETKEETNLDIKDVYYLNCIFKYNSLGAECEEYLFIGEVALTNNIVLNEENIAYKWLEIEDFVKNIKWYDSKETLKSMLRLAVNKELFFEQEKIIEI